jgi:hypothetical protein
MATLKNKKNYDLETRHKVDWTKLSPERVEVIDKLTGVMSTAKAY